MSTSNTAASYGSVAKTFHWLTALLILSNIGFGLVASWQAEAVQAAGAQPSAADLARAAWLFSTHKTLGVTIFFVALARILWAVTQPKPGLLNGDHRAEAILAELVHWLLYGSLVLVPLTGWIDHAATTGFAPIWWPFGQGLPFVPKDPHVAELFATLHYILQWVLIGAIALHVMGALKHHVIDKDATLRRMLPGNTRGEPTAKQPGHALPILGALAVWAVALLGANQLGWFPSTHDAPAAQVTQAEAEPGQWQVTSGELSIAIQQMGQEVSGQFANWTANITYDETPDAEGKHGAVEVSIDTGSLSLGSVTDQATGPDFLASGSFPTATYAAVLRQNEDRLVTDGILTIRSIEVPLSFPVTLSIEDDTATASGKTSVDRRAFGIGDSVSDEGSLAFDVVISFDLTATRAE